ncbi:hypothetical protein CHUAL_013442 [Chamberlinius hualienensis]
MGCAQTKSDVDRSDGGSGRRNKKDGKGGSEAGTGGIASPPTPAPVDPRLPLTARQIFSIGKSWKGITRAMETTGVNMFVALFNDHSELMDLFTKFQNLRTKEDQYQSMELQQHASLVMQTLDESIQALENADYFFDYVQQVGRIHYKVPGFKKEYFWKIEAPFLSAVKETLGDRYTDNIASIYEIVIRFILETLVKGYESAEVAAAAPK